MKRILIVLLISSSFLCAKDEGTTTDSNQIHFSNKQLAMLKKINNFEEAEISQKAKQAEFAQDNFVISLHPGETYAFSYKANSTTGYVTRVLADGQYLSVTTGQQSININNLMGSSSSNVAIIEAKEATYDTLTPYYLVSYKPWSTNKPDSKLIGFIHIPGKLQKNNN